MVETDIVDELEGQLEDYLADATKRLGQDRNSRS